MKSLPDAYSLLSNRLIRFSSRAKLHALSLAIASAIQFFASLAQAEPKQPNILFIFSDDHALAAISAYNDPRKLVQTPNIDRIAREGMIFNRAVVPNSICGPSRACVLTGKYSHMNGFFDNKSVFNGEQQTMPKLLRAAGYQTALIGKWHLVSDPTGFDHWDILPGQGAYFNPPMIRMGVRSKRDGYTTDIITDLSIAWLKQRDRSKPFLLMAQHKAPHREWSPNLKNLGWNGDRKFAEPETLFDDYANRGKAVRNQDMTIEKTFSPLDAKLRNPPGMTPAQLEKWNAYYEPRNEEFRKANPQGKDLVRWRYQRYMHDYLGAVLSVDESVGRLLKHLDDEGLAENTIVVYASDQGFYLGEHGWFDKRWIFEESLRMPLIIRWPGKIKPGSTNKDIVSNIDLMSTFLEAAGQTIPADIQGRSLLPLLKGQTPADWRKSFYYHYYEHPAEHSVARHYGVVTDRFKLVHFYEKEMAYWELFDLKNDPREMRSVYDEPDYATTRRELHAELNRLRAELKVTDSDPVETFPNTKTASGAQSPTNSSRRR